MNVAATNFRETARSGVRGRDLRWLAITAAVVFAFGVGGRSAVEAVRADGANHNAVSTGRAPSHVQVPASAAIEQQWGIRFIALNLLADGGLLDLEYQVVDPSKSGRIHIGGIKQLPVIQVEGTRRTVTSDSLMFHFQHENTDAPGRTYSIIYGNANGVVHPGARITIALSDGLRLHHFPVQQ
jgi:hypothetical protein